MFVAIENFKLTSRGVIMALSSYLIISSILVCIQSQVCFWGNSKADNGFLNGEYIDTGSTYNSQPTYRKNELGYDLYLAFYNPDWRITSGSPPDNNYYAQCQTSNTDVDAGCSGTNWVIGTSGSPDTAINTTYEACPEWECDGVTVSGMPLPVSDICDSRFDQKVGPNQYYNGDKYFYFNTVFFQWICARSICTTAFTTGCSYHAQSEVGWKDVIKGSTINLDIDYFQATIASVECLELTETPTNAPTIPTDQPTVQPTNEPTMLPSRSPLFVNETHAPTAIPTISPTLGDNCMRLSDGTNYGDDEYGGRVEIYHSGEFGTICNDINSNRNQTASVICRQLGYTLVVNDDGLVNDNSYIDTTPYGRGSGTIWLDDVVCNGNESEIAECSHAGWGVNNCGHHEDISIVCGGFIDNGGTNVCPDTPNPTVQPTAEPTFDPDNCLFVDTLNANLSLDLRDLSGLILNYTLNDYIWSYSICENKLNICSGDGSYMLRQSQPDHQNFWCFWIAEFDNASPKQPSYDHDTEIWTFSGYTGDGLGCTLNARDTDILWQCDQDIETAAITSIIEPSQCRYTITVNSRYACIWTLSPTDDPTEEPTFEPTFEPTINPSPNPTEEPTWDPTDIPTEEPTKNPTQHPTSDPSNNPSYEPTAITAGPTENPSIGPTNNPTRKPSTKIPTGYPTSSPSIDYDIISFNVTINDQNITNEMVIEAVKVSIQHYLGTLGMDSDYVLQSDVVDSNDGAAKIVFDLKIIDSAIVDEEELESSIQQDLDREFGSDATLVAIGEYDLEESADNGLVDQETLFQEITFIIAIILVLIVLISWIDAKYIRLNDFYLPASLITVVFHIMDTVSDIFFALTITYYPDFESTNLLYLFIASLFFIVVPIISTLIQLNHMINKHWNKSDEMRSWLSANIYKLYLLSIICGSSFTGVQLCRSNLFNLSLFDIPLTRKDAMHFETKKLYSITLLENLPQIILAILYIDYSNQHPDNIVYMSMSFSILSIIIAVIAMYSAKKLIQSQDYYSIEFDVKGSGIASNSKGHKKLNRVKKIKYEICGILGLQEDLVEILKPSLIPNGVKIVINLYINNAKAIDLNPEKILIDANNNGQLPTAIKDAWGLNTAPAISNFKYQRHESKDRAKNSVTITVKSEENNVKKNIEMQQNLNAIEMKPIPTDMMPVASTDYGDGEDSSDDDIPTANATAGQHMKDSIDEGDHEIDGNKDGDNDIIAAVNETKGNYTGKNQEMIAKVILTPGSSYEE